jgi:hypothetical protein
MLQGTYIMKLFTAFGRRHDIQHNDIRHNDIRHNGLVCDTQHD